MTTVQSPPGVVAQDLLNSVNVRRDKPAAGSPEAEADKFMTLLVTQMKNQDPLNPLDNAQVTSQLAQLSTVTGVNKLNTTLESLKASYQSSESLQAANMIGRGVLVAGDKVRLHDGVGIMGVDVPTGADKVELIITDTTTGKDVQVIDMGPQKAGTVPVAWNGIPDPKKLGADGKPIVLKNGTYLIRVVALKAGEEIKDVKTLSYDEVASVTSNAKDGVKLNLPGLGVVSIADVKQIL